MTTLPNKNSANKMVVLGALEALRAELQSGPPSEELTLALQQCDRLQLALEQFHAEGIRFAAFTLLRLVQHNRTFATPPVQNATTRLREALAQGGFPH